MIPKSEASNRSVSVPPWLIEPLRALIDGRDPDALVFVPEGATWLDPVKLQKRLDDAIARAGVPRGTLHDAAHGGVLVGYKPECRCMRFRQP